VQFKVALARSDVVQFYGVADVKFVSYVLEVAKLRPCKHCLLNLVKYDS
jgi:hypothetical protein